MSWKAVPRGRNTPPTIVDAETNSVIAVMNGYSDNFWSACVVMSKGPDFYEALADMVSHAKKNFPRDLLPQVEKYEDLLRQVKEIYDKR